MSDAWIQTWTGKAFDLLNPQQDQICIEDIAHALSLLCRYTGHAPYHFSVAQHSLNVARRVLELGGTRADRLGGLAHDMAEAYVGDVSSPLKHCLPNYREIEKKVTQAIDLKFGLDLRPLSREVIDWGLSKRADLEMLMTEAALFHPEKRRPRPWSVPVEPLPAAEWAQALAPMQPVEAEALFLAAFEALKG